MRTKLRPDWYLQPDEVDFNLDQSGVYEWQIDGVGIYVGKAKNLRRRLREYPNNVRRMLDGLAWHGDPNKKYRLIHEALRRAYDAGTSVRVVVLETCEPSARAKLERWWIEKRCEEHQAGGQEVLNSN